MTFVATLVYELGPTTSPTARKLLRAELVGRRYNEHWEGRALPESALWIRRSASPGETVVDLEARCGEELRAAVRAVEARGLPIQLTRAWVQISGAGTFGLLATEDDAAKHAREP